MERQMCVRTHLHTKPPSGQGLTLTLKGLCLATVIATPQAGDVVSTSTSMPLCVFFECACNHNVWSELLQTPSACRADCHMGLCACAMWFVYVRTTERQWQFHQLSSETQNNCAFWRRLFVVVGRQEMRSCWGIRVRKELIEERGKTRRRIRITY